MSGPRMGEDEVLDHIAAAIAQAFEEAPPASPLFAIALRYVRGPPGPRDLDIPWADEAWRDETLARGADRAELVTGVDFPHDLRGLDARLDPEVRAASDDLRRRRTSASDRKSMDRSVTGPSGTSCSAPPDHACCRRTLDAMIDRATGWASMPTSIKAVVRDAGRGQCRNGRGECQLPGGWPQSLDADLPATRRAVARAVAPPAG